MPEQVAVEASWLDLVSLVIIVTLAVAGVIKGAIRIVVGLAALTGGVLLAMRYAPALGAEGWPVIAELDDPLTVGVLVGGALILAGCLLVGALLARLLRRAAEETALSGVDRTLGLLLGLLRGVLAAALITLAVMVVSGALELPEARADAERSLSLRGTRALAHACRGWLPPDTARTLEGVLGTTEAR